MSRQGSIENYKKAVEKIYKLMEENDALEEVSGLSEVHSKIQANEDLTVEELQEVLRAGLLKYKRHIIRKPVAIGNVEHLRKVLNRDNLQ